MNIALLSLMAATCADAGLSAAYTSAAAPAQPVVIALAQAESATGSATDADAAPQDTAPEPAGDDGYALIDGPLVFEGESDEAVSVRVLDYLEAIGTLQGDFTQVAPSGAMSSGKFYLRRPGLLRFEYDPPSPLTIVATGGMVFVRDDDLETTDSYPVGKTPLKFLLRKKVELGDARLVAVDRGPDSVSVTYASDDEETEGEISLILDAPTLALEQWIIRDPQNGVTIVSLENTVAGADIPNRLFAAPETETPFLKN